MFNFIVKTQKKFWKLERKKIQQ